MDARDSGSKQQIQTAKRNFRVAGALVKSPLKRQRMASRTARLPIIGNDAQSGLAFNVFVPEAQSQEPVTAPSIHAVAAQGSGTTGPSSDFNAEQKTNMQSYNDDELYEDSEENEPPQHPDAQQPVVEQLGPEKLTALPSTAQARAGNSQGIEPNITGSVDRPLPSRFDAPPQPGVSTSKYPAGRPISGQFNELPLKSGDLAWLYCGEVIIGEHSYQSLQQCHKERTEEAHRRLAEFGEKLAKIYGEISATLIDLFSPGVLIPCEKAPGPD